MITASDFVRAKNSLETDHQRYNIGTYKERTQHLLLKLLYEPRVSFHEVPVEGYIADILNEEGITEIQTAAFRALNEKLAVFLSQYTVRVVYPVGEKKRIVWTDPETGDTEAGRYVTYPRAAFRILPELLSIVDHFGDRSLSVELVYVKASQYKVKDGYGKDRKKKASKIDTIPDELIKIVTLRNADDIRALLPFEAGQRVTNSDLSKALGLKRMSLWKAVKLLTILEILVPAEKKGRSIIYEVTAE